MYAGAQGGFEKEGLRLHKPFFVQSSFSAELKGKHAGSAASRGYVLKIVSPPPPTGRDPGWDRAPMVGKLVGLGPLRELTTPTCDMCRVSRPTHVPLQDTAMGRKKLGYAGCLSRFSLKENSTEH